MFSRHCWRDPFYGLKIPTDTRGADLREPLRTQTTENRHSLVTASLVKHYGGGYEGNGISAEAPLHAITTTDHHALLSANLIKIDQQGFTLDGSYPLDAPITTMTTKASHALVSANLIKYYGQGDPRPVNEPLGAVTTKDRFGLSAACLVRQFGTSRAADVMAPMGTITTQGGGKTLTLQADLVPGLSAAQSHTARLVYDLMARFAPDALTEADHLHRAVIVLVEGVEYVIADVGMRMLTPRELARGQSFPDSYVLEHDADGKPVTKTAQVNGIGNSVVMILAELLAEHNLVLGEAAD